MTEGELERAWLRACRLIEWMSDYVGDMAPGDYTNCYSDLNSHFIAQARYDREHGPDARPNA